MSLTLILIRHAKSDWNHPNLADHDRPLNTRGKAAAPRIGAWLAAGGHVPDRVLCSTARRTQETWDLIARHLPDAPGPTLTRGLYNAGPSQLLKIIQGATGSTLAIVAHNTGIGTLAHDLAAEPPAHPKFGLYPTGATTVYRFEATDWHAVALGAGRVVDFTTPRDLPDPDL